MADPGSALPLARHRRRPPRALQLATLFPLPLMQAVGTLTFVDRTEVRGRVEAGPSAAGGAVDVETRPSLRLDTRWRHGFDALALLYAPRLIYPHVGQGEQALDAYHIGAFAFDRERARSHFSLTGTVAAGTLSTSSMLVQPLWAEEGLPPSPTPLLQVGAEDPRFAVLYAQARAAIDFRVSRRTTVTPAVAYEANGGLDEPSRAVLALVHGPVGSLSIERQLSRADALVTTVTGAYAEVETTVVEAAPVTRGEAEQRWRHKVSRLTSTELAWGIVVSVQDPLPVQLYGIGQVSLITGFQQRSARARAAFYGRTFPWINSFSGDVEQRAEGGVAVSWTAGLTTLRLQTAAVTAFLPPEYRSTMTLFLGEAGLARQLSRRVSIDGGLRAGFQSVAVAFRSFETVQPMAFVGLTLAPMPMRL